MMCRTKISISITVAAFVFCLLGSTPSQTDAARILGYFPTPSKSHLIIHCAVADILAQAGHDVTVIASAANVYKNAKYKYIHIDALKLDDKFTNEMINKPEPLYKRALMISGQIMKLANDSYSHPQMQEFIRTHTAGSFDLLILGYFMNDFHLGLAAHFDCPVIVSFMIQPIYSVNSFIGNPQESTYVPVVFANLKQPMNFIDRVMNFLGSVMEQYIMGFLLNRSNQNYYDIHFPADRYPTLDAIRKNVSIVLANHHFSQGPIRPNVPALIEIGGIQIKEKPAKLPEDIATLLDNAKNGVIYFSLGSNVQGTHLREDKVKLIYDVLSKLPYEVLWKWGDTTDYPGTAANIHYKSWLPQDDILAHPNIKLFITHGGQGSVVESQYHGVPMVGIPLFGDQPRNMANVERAGYGLGLDYLSLTAEDFRTTILEVLQNRKYADSVKQFSTLYRDRPMTPRQTALFWVDYVLRHKGAKHLQSPAVFLNGWQLLSLDVIGFLLAIIALLVVIVISCYRAIKAYFKSKSKQRATNAKKKKINRNVWHKMQNYQFDTRKC